MRCTCVDFLTYIYLIKIENFVHSRSANAGQRAEKPNLPMNGCSILCIRRYIINTAAREEEIYNVPFEVSDEEGKGGSVI